MRAPGVFAGKTVFLRAFAGFTQSEMLILRQVLLHAQDVFVLLDSSDVRNKLSEVDRAVNRTASRLLGLARRLETKVAPLMRMQREQKQDGALNFLAEHAFLDSEETWEGEVSSVVLKCANDPYEEVAPCMRADLHTGARGRVSL